MPSHMVCGNCPCNLKFHAQASLDLDMQMLPLLMCLLSSLANQSVSVQPSHPPFNIREKEEQSTTQSIYK